MNSWYLFRTMWLWLYIGIQRRIATPATRMVVITKTTKMTNPRCCINSSPTPTAAYVKKTASQYIIINMTLSMQLPMLRSQALCRDAESVRHEQVKKTVFNNALWTKLMCMVKEHPELQTATIPSKPTKGQSKKTQTMGARSAIRSDWNCKATQQLFTECSGVLCGTWNGAKVPKRDVHRHHSGLGGWRSEWRSRGHLIAQYASWVDITSAVRTWIVWYRLCYWTWDRDKHTWHWHADVIAANTCGHALI